MQNVPNPKRQGADGERRRRQKMAGRERQAE
jgi:hypothetical protein